MRTYLFKFEGCELQIPVERSRSIKVDTSQQSFLISHLKDLQCELCCIDHLSRKISKVNSYLDVMAGSGFSGRMIEKRFDPKHMWLNDLNPDSFECLQSNFPNAHVTQGDANEIIVNDVWDLIFVDFNTFTSKHVKDWPSLFRAIHSKFKNLWIIDTASYVYRFGPRIFEKAYGTTNMMLYYLSLGVELSSTYPNFHLANVAIFENMKAAIVHFKNKPSEINVENVPSTININYRPIEGFGF